MVTGSRGWTDRQKIERVLVGIDDEVMGGRIEFLHGGARGVDLIAAEVAASLGWVVVEFKADWEGKGKKAGIWRNVQMLDENPSRVLAFWDGTSKGTRHAFGEAIKRGIATDIYVRRSA
jgi:hypothetical protein